MRPEIQLVGLSCNLDLPEISWSALQMAAARFCHTGRFALASRQRPEKLMTAIGFRQGRTFDPDRPNWDGTDPRPLGWAAWYPALGDASHTDSCTKGWFSSPPVIRDAAIDRSRDPYPLLLLSHGSGGSANGLNWLAHRLAKRGFVVVAANHHGHTGVEPYRAEGFLCLWERARDLSVLLDAQDWREPLQGHVDTERVFAGGFSAGAYTALLLAGAVARFSQFDPANPIGGSHRGPLEFPTVADEIPGLLESSGVFRESWARVSLPYRDDRFKAFLACAPGRSVLCFDEESLGGIHCPVLIVTGGADKIAPVGQCSQWLCDRINGSQLAVVAGAGHYIFLPEPTAKGLDEGPQLFADSPGVNRAATHDHVAELAFALFSGAR
jgi:predicted dienelactone hydrolase